MDKIHYKGEQIPIITKSGSSSDVVYKSPGQQVTPAEADYIQKNVEIQNALGSDETVRRSTLVEIPTPTSRIIYKIKAFFPFDLFPDELIIDEIKVSFVYHGFLNRQVITVLIKDISDVIVTNNLFFGAIQINGGDYQGLSSDGAAIKGALMINYLKINEANMARRIILGLKIYSDQKVDTSQMPINEIVEKTAELGRAQEI